jgi:hypothetical protein
MLPARFNAEATLCLLIVFIVIFSWGIGVAADAKRAML